LLIVFEAEYHPVLATDLQQKNIQQINTQVAAID